MGTVELASAVADPESEDETSFTAGWTALKALLAVSEAFATPSSEPPIQ